MDSKTRNRTILLVVSLFILAIGVVVYTNKQNNGGKAPAVSGNGLGEDISAIPDDQLHAFLYDETFFDYEDNFSAYITENVDTSTLYLIANSVDHDIRIAITDVFGHPVTGQPFVVKIDGIGEYKDANQDGIITIPDMNAGDYYISLEQIGDYKVPETPMKVQVKKQLEFAVIEDISFYIYTEDMIDFLSEDTKEEIDANDYDTGAYTLGEQESKGTWGIDVSKYQKDIDWNKVAASGVKFVIIRCGYRGSKSGVLVEDPYFRKNIEGATAAGLKVGVYFFTQAISETEAVEEASMVATLCRDYVLDYPVFIDTEGAGGRADGLSKEMRTDVVVAFCKTLESCGYKPGVYSSRCWFYDKLEDSRLQDYVLWDAEYRSTPLYNGNYKLWQYSSKGTIDGISTYVDLNMCYTTFD